MTLPSKIRGSFRSLKRKAAAGLVLMLPATASLASGTTGMTGDPFYDFMVWAEGLAQGPLGIALALLSFIIGAGFAIAKQAPLSALTGLVLAVFFTYGPTIIIEMMTGGAVL